MPPTEEIVETEVTEEGQEPEAKKVPSAKENSVPLSRLNEVIADRNSVRKELDELKAQIAEANRKQAEMQGNYKSLYEEAAPKAKLADELEKTLKNVLEVQIAEIPEKLRSLVPSTLSPSQQLEWIAKNRELLTKPRGAPIGSGAGGRTPEKGEDEVELSDEEKAWAKSFGVSEKDYAKHKTV